MFLFCIISGGGRSSVAAASGNLSGGGNRHGQITTRTKAVRSLTSGIALPASATPGIALSTPAIPAPQPARQPVGRVVLATVVNQRNRPLVDVGVDDFVVTEGGASREVLDVHIADYPVVLLLDTAPDTAEALPALKSAVVRFISRIGERPVAIGTLSSGALVASFDDDRAEALARVNAIAPGAAPDQGGVDAIANAAAILRDARVPFSTIAIATAHTIGADAPVSASLVSTLLESGASVQVVVARAAGDAPSRDADLLHVLADQTHGQYTPIFAAASFSIALDRIADRMATEVMIEYVAPDAPPAGDVRVGARIPGTRVVGLGVRRIEN